MLTAGELEDKVAWTLKTAADWKAKGNADWELRNLGSALETLLFIAVAHHDSAQAGVAYLHAKHTEELLGHYNDLNATLLNQSLEDPQKARAADRVTFTHIGWLLGRHAAGDANLAIICHPAVAKDPPTKFWAEYNRAMACLVARQPYVPPPAERRFRGYEKHWASYVGLVAALTAGRDTASALGACAVSFMRRNRDRRLSSGWLYDGDGHTPVRWDFRLASILGRWRAGTSQR
jgi:hypothetical protein